MLEFFIAVVIDAKKLLKRFVKNKNQANLPLTNKGGIAGILK